MHCTRAGRWAQRTHAISVLPWKTDAKIYRTVSLQNISRDSPWSVSVKYAMENVQLVFEKIQLIFFTVYGPTLAGAPTVVEPSATGIEVNT